MLRCKLCEEKKIHYEGIIESSALTLVRNLTWNTTPFLVLSLRCPQVSSDLLRKQIRFRTREFAVPFGGDF